jgi:hypothetical protein
MVASLLLLGRGPHPELLAPIAVGAVLPDSPMLIFYAWERGVLGTAERVIWSSSYWDPGWQAAIDSLNSLPLIALGLLLSWRLGAPRMLALFASMALHCLCDLAVHHDDAHRHLFPFSDWRFASPVSYWDPAHHGRIFAGFEIVGVLVGSAWLARRSRQLGLRLLLAAICGVYALYIAWAIVVWL